jgi:transposase
MPKQIRQQLSQFEKGQIIALWDQKLSKKEIAKKLKRARSTIRSVIERFDTSNSTERKKGSGRPRKTTKAQDRIIKRIALKKRFLPAIKIGNELNLDVTPRTIRNRLKDAKIMSRVAAKKPFISKANLNKRIAFAKKYKHWTPEDWKKVVFADESSVILRDSSKRRVWRRNGERFKPDCIRGTIKHDKKVMIWGCISSNGAGDLHRIQGILDAAKYKQILIHHLRPSIRRLFSNENECFFAQDNDPKHSAKIITNYLNNCNMNVLEWPAQSPDLNPIENVWAELKRRTKERQPSTEEELFQLLKEEWNKLDLPYLTSLYESMPKRCYDVIKSKGYPIKY